jgi:hypothetical protein
VAVAAVGQSTALAAARHAASVSCVGQNQGMNPAAASPAVAMARPGDALRALRRSADTEHVGAGNGAVLVAADRFDVEHGVSPLHSGLRLDYVVLSKVDHECWRNVIAAATETLDVTIKLIGKSAEDAGTGKIPRAQRGVFDDVMTAANTSAWYDPRADATAVCSNGARALTLTGLAAATGDAGGGA